MDAHIYSPKTYSPAPIDPVTHSIDHKRVQPTFWHCSEAVTSVETYEDWLFAGTISGKIHVYNLKTYQHSAKLDAHGSSVLVLCVRHGVLISGSGDSLVKVWLPTDDSLELLHTVYSVHDVGDVFCLEYLNETRTVYFGTQNASINWVTLPKEPTRNNSHKGHPAVRPNKFFDSAGPGGKLHPQQYDSKKLACTLGEDATLLQVPTESTINFAHNGYVYAMVATKLMGQSCIVTGSSDGTIKIWMVKGGCLVETAVVNVEHAVLGMATLSPWQMYCTLESGDGIILDLETLQVIKRAILPGTPLLTLTVMSGTAYIAAGSAILCYDPVTKGSLRWACSDEITATVALKSRNSLVSASRDGVIAIWNVSGLHTSVHNDEIAWKTFLKHGLSDESMIDILGELLKFRSVSKRDVQYWNECRACASAFRSLFQQLGAESRLIKVDNGNPIVYAKFKARRSHARTSSVLFYGHYDVIDAEESLWDTHPFELANIDGYLRGRGVSDNKGPCIAAMFAAAALYASNKLDNDIRFLIEGEEENGSFGFYKAIEQEQQNIGNKFDWIIFSNSYWINDEIPCVNYGLRGVAFFDLEIKNNKSEVHSGVDGGSFREPALDMVNLLGQLSCKKTGEIIIPGFFENVLPLTEDDDKLLDEISARNPQFTKEMLKQKWCFPTLTIHNVNVGDDDTGASVIPNTVKSTISFRIVPNQTAAEIKAKTQKYIEECFASLNSSNEFTIKCVYSADPWLGECTSDPYRIMKDSLTRHWHTDPLLIREGGTIPMARALEKLFDAPAAQLPCGQSSDSAHLRNERLRITNLINAKLVFTDLFSELKARTGS